MKSIFDKTERDKLINRIATIDESHKAQWGKMTVYQMLKHCSLWEEMIFGKQKYRRHFIGYLFGKMALKGITKDQNPLKRNSPSIAELKFTDDGDIHSEKRKWIDLMEQYAQVADITCDHPFFGRINKEQIGILAYKHADHHLRQFNV